MSAEIGYLGIGALTEAYRRREFSPVEVTHHLLSRARRLNSNLHAFITFTDDEAIKQASESERRFLSKAGVRALEGIPVGLKDLIHMRGVPTTAGSRVMEGFVAEEDATVVTRLRLSGVALLGKLHLHEFAFGVTSQNPNYGNVANPWGLDYIAGGSSGGPAAAVAAGLCPAAIGSDTGGSIRIPAALCGVVGLKPTYGLISLRGVIPASWTQDHLGTLTRSVKDAALLLNVLAGYDPGDPGSKRIKIPDYSQGLAEGVKGLRIGVPRAFFFEGLEPAVEQAVEGALLQLEKLGAKLEEVSIPLLEPAAAAGFLIILADAAAYHQQYLPERAHLYTAEIRERLEAGRAVSAIEYINAQRMRRVFTDSLLELLKKVDLLCTPTTAITAPRHDEVSAFSHGMQADPRPLLTRLTRHFNVSGLPAISIPCGFGARGLPVGLQFAGRPFEEKKLLKAAYAYETITSWAQQRPPLLARDDFSQ